MVTVHGECALARAFYVEEVVAGRRVRVRVRVGVRVRG